MRFLRKKFKNNVKYILTELVLIFIGIYLALSLNNWNESKRIEREKASVITKLEEEVQKNLSILNNAKEENLKFFRAMERYGELDGNDATQITATEEEYEQLMANHGDYFLFEEKTKIDAEKYLYEVSLQINFKFTELRDIAWSTAKTAGFAREFNYDCLLSIEDTYRDQQDYTNEMDKILPIIVESEYARLPITSSLARQYGTSLITSYENLLPILNGCR